MNLVISPTLNEAENIDQLVEGVLALEDFNLLIVDDDSGDGTWQRVAEISESEKRVHLLHRRSNRGFGKSYLDAFRWALQRSDVRYLFTMDADLSHSPEYLPAIMDALADGADLVVGSRYISGGGVANWPFWRRGLSRNANRFAKFITRMPVNDCTAGFNGLNVSFMRTLNLESLVCNSYGFLIELKYLCWSTGARITEVPILFRDRERGQTKFNSRMINEAIVTCLRLRKTDRKPARKRH